MTKLKIPTDYKPILDLGQTQLAIKKVKDFFQKELAYYLVLRRTTAPLFVTADSGLNDNLNGVERTVDFTLRDMDDKSVEIVQSLAKWKRMALGKYGVDPGKGIYTDMNAIRRDEELDNLHSIYVDQWDWEKTIEKEDRTEVFLKDTVLDIWAVLKATESYVMNQYPEIYIGMPEEIFFITAQELEDMYPDLSPNEREEMITKDKRAVFIMQIGGRMKSGERHDGRAPDYDDWKLNGDIIVWDDVLECAIELSSMGIRVDEDTLIRQLEEADALDRKNLDFHRKVLSGELPYTIGGGIGQSRLCMYFLKKAHIGEVQVSVWPEGMIEKCAANNIPLL